MANDIITQQDQQEVGQWLKQTDARILGAKSDIKEIYDRVVELEKKGPYLTRREAKELEQKLSSILNWAKKVSQKTGIALPRL